MNSELKNLIETIDRLNESPRYRDEELQLGTMAKISLDSLGQGYSLIGSVANNLVQVYEKNTGSSFIAGFKVKEAFGHFLSISTRAQSYPVVPTQLRDYKQVSMVRVAEGYEQQGSTVEVYNLIAKKYDLVSDHEQYKFAKPLWKSLARNSDVNVYVFADSDYVRDSTGRIIRYNGKNIDDSKIWGGIERVSTLLVASVEEKK